MKLARNLLLTTAMLSAGLPAGEVEIVAARAEADGNGRYRFDVTLRHADTGWDHYADGWQVLAPDGRQLGERVLYHPHVNEQPFTRSLGGITVPVTAGFVTIRAHDSVHGHSERQWRIDLPTPR